MRMKQGSIVAYDSTLLSGKTAHEWEEAIID